MPLYLCTAHNGGINIFKTEEWMRIWGFVFVVTLIFNTFWGWFMDRFVGSGVRCSPSVPWPSITYRNGSVRMR